MTRLTLGRDGFLDRFRCRAITADCAGQSVPLREIVKAHNEQRRGLNKGVRDRRQALYSLAGASSGSGTGHRNIA